MRKKSMKRLLTVLLATAMVLTACGQKPAANTSETKESEKVEETTAGTDQTSEPQEEVVVKKEDLPVISIYPNNANLPSGLVEGFRSDVFAEYGFQVEVWSYSDDKTTAMLTSGDLPDIIQVTGRSDVEETLITTGKVINYDDYKEYLPNFYENPSDYRKMNMDFARENLSYGTGGLYYLPVDTGAQIVKWKDVSPFDRNIVKVKWDVYEAIGKPEVNDYWDLIDIMEDMMEYQPTAADGTKMYGTYLDNGKDSTRFGSMELWYRWDGYNENLPQYFIEGQHKDGKLRSILTEDSKYYEGLKWYNEVYRRGLMDPDSISTSRGDQAPKLDNALAMIPSGTLPGAAPNYFEVYVPGSSPYIQMENNVVNTTGGGWLINAETEYLEECLAYINAAADQEFCLKVLYGPEGDVWQKEGNVLSLTDRFKEHFAEYGNVNGFPMSDGTDWFNWSYGIFYCATAGEMEGYVGVDGKEICLIPYMWPDGRAISDASENLALWREYADAQNLWEYFDENGIEYCTESKLTGLVLPKPSDEQSLQISAINSGIVTQSWLCVYAKTDEEFDAAWKKLVDDALGLGAQEIIDWRIKCYEDVFAAQK